jgi:hypothetical protein
MLWNVAQANFRALAGADTPVIRRQVDDAFEGLPRDLVIFDNCDLNHKTAARSALEQVTAFDINTRFPRFAFAFCNVRRKKKLSLSQDRPTDLDRMTHSPGWNL